MIRNVTALHKSVVLITSADEKNSSFGTAFVVYCEGETSHLLTCAHVVEKVGGEDSVIAGGFPATVVANGLEQGVDLAVLLVEHNIDNRALALETAARAGDEFQTAGFSALTTSDIAIQTIQGRLGLPTRLSVTDAPARAPLANAWVIEADDEIPEGCSGAPVVGVNSQRVLGIISHKRDSGKTGIAISIDAIDRMNSIPAHVASLAGGIRHSDLLPSTALMSETPLMNLKAELRIFERIVRGQDRETRLILVHGRSGYGKTRLLDEYERRALEERWGVLRKGLGQQISIEGFLTQLVGHLGRETFTKYDEFVLKDREEPWTLFRQNEWHRSLTQRFLSDLNERPDAPSLVVLLDQFEKSDRIFKEWLRALFLPGVSASGRLVVVVAGQDRIASTLDGYRYRSFVLDGVETKHYSWYAQERGVPIGQQEIIQLHEFAKGSPKLFADWLSLKTTRVSDDEHLDS